MASGTRSRGPVVPETEPALFTLADVRSLQRKGDTVAQASKFFGVPVLSFMTDLRERLKLFGWKIKNGKEMRLNYEDIELQVTLMKIDIHKVKLEERCLVVSINDSDMFAEVKKKLSRRLGEGVYTFWYMRSEEWIKLDGPMDYERCVSHFKDVVNLIPAQNIATNLRPRLRMEIYAQLTPPTPVTQRNTRKRRRCTETGDATMDG